MGAHSGGGPCRDSDNVIPFPDRRQAHSASLGDPGSGAQLHVLTARASRTGRRPALLPGSATAATFRVHVTVAGSHPQIWRRLEVGSDLELAQVCEAVRTAFGWTGDVLHLCHLTSAVPWAEGEVLSPDYGGWDRAGWDESGVRLDAVIARVGDELGITIIDESGDQWHLQLVLDERIERRPLRRARCLGGARSRPPVDAEDIGSYNLAVAQWWAGVPAARRAVWWPPEHEPDAFDLEATDDLLALVVADPVVAAAARQIEVCNALVDLHARCTSDGRAVLDGLLTAAAVGAGAGIPEHVDLVVQPWQVLIDAVGTGVDLLERRVPIAVRDRLVSVTRSPAQASRMIDLGVRLGLLRRAHGRLLLTAVARQGSREPALLWRHLAARLPRLHTRMPRDAGLVVMLQVAAGAEPDDAVTARVLGAAGWTDRELSVGPVTARRRSRAVCDVLLLTGADPHGRGVVHATDHARGLCRMALRPVF